MKFELKLHNRDIKDVELLKDLQRVANELGFLKLESRVYNKHGKYHSGTISKRFGTWNKALEAANLEVSNYSSVSDEDLLGDLKRVSKTVSPKTVTQAV